jgi:hypothetical protein
MRFKALLLILFNVFDTNVLVAIGHHNHEELVHKFRPRGGFETIRAKFIVHINEVLLNAFYCALKGAPVLVVHAHTNAHLHALTVAVLLSELAK